MHQTLDVVVQLDDGAEVQDLGHLAGEDGADGVPALDRGPRVRLDLLDAQGEALVLDVDVEDLGLDFLPLLVGVLGVLLLGGPGDVRHVHQPVDAVLDAEEEAEGRDVADLRADDGADRVGLPQALPGVLLDLLHAEGDPLVLHVDVQDQRLDDVAGADHLGGVLHPLGPAHLGDVHQALDALLELDERAVVGEVDHLAGDLRIDVVPLDHVQPRILGDLLEAQGDPLGLGVELQDLDLHLVAHAEHLGGVVDPAPGHVGDVEEAVDPAEVHEATVLGDVLDDPVDDLADLEVLEGLLLELLALLLEKGTP